MKNHKFVRLKPTDKRRFKIFTVQFFNLFEHVLHESINKNVNIFNVLLKNEYSIHYANSEILSK